MFAWIAQNLGTILISAVLLVIVIAIVRYLIRQKKQGKSSCGAGCAHSLPGHIGKTLAINYPSEEAKSPILKAFIQIVRENLQEYITDAGKE